MNSIAQRKHTAADSLSKYTSPRGGYAFRTYDLQPTHRSEGLLPDDILAANLLSLRLSANDVIPLFAEGDEAPQKLLEAMNTALVALSEERPFEAQGSTADLDRALATLMNANEAAKSVPGWTSVTVSKVLHRQAPQIVPIIDSRVRNFYGVRKNQDRKLYHLLWNDLRENEGWLADLGRDYRTADDRELSLLRVADILIWMPSTDPNAPTIDDLTPVTWDHRGLEARGWEGFTPLATLDLSAVPDVPGVYAVLRSDTTEPEFLPERPEATARQAYSYTESDLRSRWVPEASVLNLGRAGTSLRKRLRQYRKFGEGTGLNHKGGRSVWQLTDADRLTVAWRQFPVTFDGLSTRAAESGLIEQFQEAHGGARPFANRIR
ncbi:DUF6308 family protein [Brachybacterium tyrofermentans]|uniref:DUF6308 family protein n=1 Tax=Brachybacterium tyrofermentans TaxID=47848 RepID=UPI003FD4C72A